MTLMTFAFAVFFDFNCVAVTCLRLSCSVVLQIVSDLTVRSKSLFEAVKVKLSLCLTKHHAMKTYGGVEV